MEHFHYRRVQFTLGALDPNLVPRVYVNLDMRDVTDPSVPTAHAKIPLTAQTPQQTWILRQALNSDELRILASTAWEDPRGEVHEMEDQKEIAGDTLSVLGPYQDMLNISVIPAVPNWTDMVQMQVELRYVDGDYVFDRTLSFDGNKKATQSVSIPLLHKTQRSYQWRLVSTRKDGTVAQTDWATSDQRLLVVGAEKKTTADVRVVWVAASGDVLGMRVDFWVAPAEDPAASVFLVAGQEKVATIPLTADGRIHYRYEVRRVTASGEELVKTDESDTALLIVH